LAWCAHGLADRRHENDLVFLHTGILPHLAGWLQAFGRESQHDVQQDQVRADPTHPLQSFGPGPAANDFAALAGQHHLNRQVHVWVVVD